MDNKTEQEIYLESDGIQNVAEPEGGDLGSNTVSTAIELQPSVWTDGRIIYPEGEVWYKFTPSVSGYYTIYTIGDSDTVGFLYDAEQNLLTDADSNGVATNFKLVYNLEEGHTYYIKVMLCGNEIGDFSIAVTNTVWVESVTVSDEELTLNKGETLTLTATVLPSYATNKAVRWGSSNADIVEVNTFTGEITAKGRGTARICALSQDGSAKMSCCEVTVNVLVDSVTVEPATRVMHVEAQEQFTATVLPLDANNRLLEWHSSDTTVVTINPATGKATPHAVSDTPVYIYATAQDGSGKQGVCAVTVLPAVPVQGIVMCPDTHTMNVGESAYLSYDIYPAEATNKTLTWCSSDPDVAEVDLSTGEITAKRAGITTVTATTNDGSFSASCEISVYIDTVTIQKDGELSNIIFGSGKIWKCARFTYNVLNKTKVPLDIDRINDNAAIDFTVQELGLLFRLDPDGVIDYVKHKQFEGDVDPTERLIYRDDIFYEIYGRQPQYFVYENSQLSYRVGINRNNRYSVYSEAEVIFGVLPRWTAHNIIQTLLDVGFCLISNIIPLFDKTLLTLNKIVGFFFTGAFDGSSSAAAIEFVEDALEEGYEDVLSGRICWAFSVVNLITGFVETALPPDLDEVQINIYENACQNRNYLLKISDNNQTLTLNELIEHYKHLLPK